MEEDVENGNIPFTGYAFVTFNFEQDAKAALNALQKPKILRAVWTKLRHVFCFSVPRSRNPLLGRHVIV